MEKNLTTGSVFKNIVYFSLRRLSGERFILAGNFFLAGGLFSVEKRQYMAASGSEFPVSDQTKQHSAKHKVTCKNQSFLFRITHNSPRLSHCFLV